MYKKHIPNIPKNIERTVVNIMYPGMETFLSQKIVMPKNTIPHTKDKKNAFRLSDSSLNAKNRGINAM